LIDCPGVVYDTGDGDANLVLKGVIRPEKIHDPSVYIQAILDRVDKDHISRIYGVD
jgi:nuclear GTP-binding protein